ncbi:MAG: reactive intermediate/imine deaminase [Parcubacteria group bacterium CG08_land_8_20_14_0_20_38_56]|nr:MAG: reactive intermediate/imine deaminase [Parcubacteria group bacterium CG08_land_8_20_14_0_20_38_56]
MKAVKTDKAPLPIGPYSQATIDGSYVFCSGQLGINPNLPEDQEFNRIPYSAAEQTKQIFENFKAILEKAGTGLDRVVKTTVYLVEERDFKEMNEVYSEYFGKTKPGRTTVIVNRLPVWNAKVEMDIIAVLPWHRRILNLF